MTISFLFRILGVRLRQRWLWVAIATLIACSVFMSSILLVGSQQFGPTRWLLYGGGQFGVVKTDDSGAKRWLIIQKAPSIDPGFLLIHFQIFLLPIALPSMPGTFRTWPTWPILFVPVAVVAVSAANAIVLYRNNRCPVCGYPLTVNRECSNKIVCTECGLERKIVV
jgi:hypothetical protein